MCQSWFCVTKGPQLPINSDTAPMQKSASLGNSSSETTGTFPNATALLFEFLFLSSLLQGFKGDSLVKSSKGSNHHKASTRSA